ATPAGSPDRAPAPARTPPEPAPAPAPGRRASGRGIAPRPGTWPDRPPPTSPASCATSSPAVDGPAGAAPRPDPFPGSSPSDDYDSRDGFSCTARWGRRWRGRGVGIRAGERERVYVGSPGP